MTRRRDEQTLGLERGDRRDGLGVEEGSQLGVVGQGRLIELGGNHLQRSLQFDNAT